MLGNPRHHARSDFILVVKRKDEIRISLPLKDTIEGHDAIRIDV
jgi:hypothetical protein